MSYAPTFVDPMAVARTLYNYTPGAIDYFSLKFDESLRDTSVMLLVRQNEIEMARQGTAISEDEWKNSNDFYRAGLKYEDGMTRELAKLQAEAYDREQLNAQLYKNTSLFMEAVGFLGSIAGAALDPLNYVPYARFLPLGLATKAAAQTIKASALRNMFEGAAGAAALQPLLGSVRSDLQLDYDAGYAAHDILAGAGAGLVFGTIGGYVAKKFTGYKVDAADATKVEDAPPVSEAEPLVSRTMPMDILNLDEQRAILKQKIIEYDEGRAPRRTYPSSLKAGYELSSKEDLLTSSFKRAVLENRRAAKQITPASVPASDVEGIIYTGRMHQFSSKVKYEVVDASKLITSATADGTANAKYPKRLAKLSTESAADVKAKIVAIAQNPDIAKLVSRTGTPEDGAPVISSRREVLDGNARAVGLAEMHRANPQAADAYRASLIENGFLPEGSKIKSPVLVRRIEEPDSVYSRKGGQQQFVMDANQDYGNARFDSKVAMEDGNRIRTETSNLYDNTVSLDDAKNDAFFNELAADVLSEANEVRLPLPESGRVQLNADDLNRVRNAFYGKVFDDVNSVADIRNTPKNQIINKAPIGKLHATAAKMIDAAMAPLTKMVNLLDSEQIDPIAGVDLLNSYHKAVREVADLKERAISIERRIEDILRTDPEMHGKIQTGSGDALDARTLRFMQLFQMAQAKPDVASKYLKQAIEAVADPQATDVKVGALLDSLVSKANAEVAPGTRLKGPKAANEDLRFDSAAPEPAENLDAPPLEDAQIDVANKQADTELGDLDPAEGAEVAAAIENVKNTQIITDAVLDVAPCAIRTS